MFFFQDACIVLTTNKTSTTIEDVLKQAYNATLHQITLNSIPETSVNHRLLYQTTDTAKTTITVDGIANFLLKNNLHIEKDNLPYFYTFYDSNSTHQLLADKPVILIHVKQDKDSKLQNTNLNDLLHLCLSIFLTLKNITVNQMPIKQVIITAYIYSLYYKKFKIVVDGQTIYDGQQQNTLGHRLHLLQKDWRDLNKRITNILTNSADEMINLQPVLSRVRQLLLYDVTRVIYDGDMSDLDHVRDHVLDELCDETMYMDHQVRMYEEEL